MHFGSKKVVVALIDSWWVAIFFLLTYGLYENGVAKLHGNYMDLQGQQDRLLAEKREAVEKQKRLKLQIESQRDPLWIELTLMKGLGLVPKGTTKVFFDQNRLPGEQNN